MASFNNGAAEGRAGGSLAVPGIRLGVTGAGIRYQNRDDLLVMELGGNATTAAVFTRNRFCAAPVTVARDHLSRVQPRYLLINSGNANAGTGAAGIRDALDTCASLAELVGCSKEQVLPFSTGVIGESLPTVRLGAALPRALDSLSIEGWMAGARAIMTTDTVPKIASRQFQSDGRQVTVTGIAKGSGMICPDMATMLAFIATDLKVERQLLQDCLAQAVTPSFNAITVDGDTSTNDACVLVATGAVEQPSIDDTESDVFRLLCENVRDVCMELARAIIKDGEGATKLVEVRVEAARNSQEARNVAYTIAHSPLVKTALFASDPNWGRILAAVGRSDIEALAIENVELWLDNVCVVRNGARAGDYTEAAGKSVMNGAEFVIQVRLGRGASSFRLLTCDLSHDYVRINADYRT
ncbi:MAG: bifunctional glutamate N-acetyltransferase/amino-acid acetyltransferase ArgJ [Gammaproteobacteria bacterium]|nr:bifunctional glutamate N-acetyltransferase/amino-acid acetyltransferase ArgJ [Gammaproteobacteria bacterium]